MMSNNNLTVVEHLSRCSLRTLYVLYLMSLEKEFSVYYEALKESAIQNTPINLWGSIQALFMGFSNFHITKPMLLIGGISIFTVFLYPILRDTFRRPTPAEKLGTETGKLFKTLGLFFVIIIKKMIKFLILVLKLLTHQNMLEHLDDPRSSTLHPVYAFLLSCAIVLNVLWPGIESDFTELLAHHESMNTVAMLALREEILTDFIINPLGWSQDAMSKNTGKSMLEFFKQYFLKP